jgi:hypothetical protein
MPLESTVHGFNSLQAPSHKASVVIAVVAAFYVIVAVFDVRSHVDKADQLEACVSSIAIQALTPAVASLAKSYHAVPLASQVVLAVI